MITADDFLSLQRRVQQLQRDRDKAAGAVDQLMKQLRKEFGCKSIEQAEALLEKYKDEELAALKEYNTAKAAFERKWADKLEEKDD
jgi:predicted transcriptional regulator